MKHHHTKQIAKNFPPQQNGIEKKSGVLLMLNIDNGKTGLSIIHTEIDFVVRHFENQ